MIESSAQILARFYPGEDLVAIIANALLQVTAILIIACALSGLLRHRPAARHGLWTCALAMVLLSALAAWESRRSEWSWWTTPLPALAQERGMTPTPPGAGQLQLEHPSPLPAISRSVTMANENTAIKATSVGNERIRAAIVCLFLIWLFGMCLPAARLLRGFGLQSAMRRIAVPLSEVEIPGVANEVATALGMQSIPVIATSSLVRSPLSLGIVSSIVLLPPGLPQKLGRDELIDVLVHECAHVMRHDHLVALLQRIARIIFWFHPLIHCLDRELSRAREEVCDNHVLRRGPPARYLRTLVRLAESIPLHGGSATAIGIFHPRWSLEQRVSGLLDYRRGTATRMDQRFLVAVTALFTCLVIGIAGCHSPERSEIPAASQSTQPNADDTGRWSEAVNGLRARLKLDKQVLRLGPNDVDFIRVEVEFENVGNTALALQDENPLLLHPQLSDMHGQKLVSQATPSHLNPTSHWLRIAPGSTARIMLSQANAQLDFEISPGDPRGLLDTNTAFWNLRVGTYTLSLSYQSSRKSDVQTDSPAPPWRGTLRLPSIPLRIELAEASTANGAKKPRPGTGMTVESRGHGSSRETEFSMVAGVPLLVYGSSRASKGLISLPDGTLEAVDRGVTWHGVLVCETLTGDLIGMDAQTRKVMWTCRNLSPYWEAITFAQLKIGSGHMIWAVELRPSPDEDLQDEREYHDLNTGQKIEIMNAKPTGSGNLISITRAWAGGDSSVALSFHLLVTSHVSFESVYSRLCGQPDHMSDSRAQPARIGLKPSEFRLLRRVPDVDFEKEVVLVVSAGDSWNCEGFSVQEATEQPSRIVVRLKALYYQTIGDANYSRPYGVIVLPRRLGKEYVVEQDMQRFIGGPPQWKERFRLELSDPTHELDSLPPAH